jgi:hypothetical protein
VGGSIVEGYQLHVVLVRAGVDGKQLVHARRRSAGGEFGGGWDSAAKAGVDAGEGELAARLVVGDMWWLGWFCCVMRELRRRSVGVAGPSGGGGAEARRHGHAVVGTGRWGRKSVRSVKWERPEVEPSAGGPGGWQAEALACAAASYLGEIERRGGEARVWRWTRWGGF